jgi:L-seryl-tRNA(Ser) seleniumtransferase
LGEPYAVELIDSTSEIGSGALPIESLPTKTISITHPRYAADDIARRFRLANPPIIGRIHSGRFLLDLRGIFAAEDLVPQSSAICRL